ncbi:MAG: bifunctional hydroxymethylpyrimidine kinase/phosphomethylpyrimidine kinase [Pyrinomonadaceae bacterium]|nr:bifunctional hydroxymethylpyrimidine kinase/phosphomethylpyrimidine kinase [Pyrinomonadaceae bacterium]
MKAISLKERLTALVNFFPQRRIVVVGDLVADQFLYGEISRVSREAPVMILRHERTETVPGGAANCAANLAALGARAALIGVVGQDQAGQALVLRLRDMGVDCRGVVRAPQQRTATKVRILAGQAHSMRQQVIRVDYESAPLTDDGIRAQLATRLNENIATADAVIVSDYNYGVAGAEIAKTLRGIKAAGRVPVLVDSRFRLLDFVGLTSATPNEDEVEQVLGRRIGDTAALEAAAKEMRARLGFQALLVTRGNQGMTLAELGREPEHFPAVGSREAVDVTGAGDTVIATYALALALGASYTDAAHLANHAGGIVVMKRGTAVVTAQELLASLKEMPD